MERLDIERRDFPTARRGYETAAVDAHLRRVADELESLRARSLPAAPAALSAGTSERVRVILEAAEASAAALREQAERDAFDHVARVEDAAKQMLARLGALEDQLQGLVAELHELRAQAGSLAPRIPEPEDAAPAGAGPSLDAEPAGAEPSREAEPAVGEPSPRAEPAVGEPPPRAEPAVGEPPQGAEPAVAEPPPGVEPAGIDDDAGARLTALNMALAGAPREETARFLAEHYRLSDADGLLDDVYARATG